MENISLSLYLPHALLSPFTSKSLLGPGCCQLKKMLIFYSHFLITFNCFKSRFLYFSSPCLSSTINVLEFRALRHSQTLHTQIRPGSSMFAILTPEVVVFLDAQPFDSSEY